MRRRRRPRPGKAVAQDFNPNSVDATIATVLERLDSQDEARSQQHEENKKVLGEILVQAKATNGRVTQSEKDIAAIREEFRGKWKEAFAWIGGACFVAMIVWTLFVHFAK